MADPIAVARKRAIAEKRLHAASQEASKAFGVPYKQVHPIQKREPALAAASLIENAAELIENVTATKKRT